MVSPDGLTLKVLKEKGFQGFSDQPEKFLEILGGALNRFKNEGFKGKICAVAAGIAGIFEEEEKENIKGILKQAYPDLEFFITSDAEMALYTATSGKRGVILIAGTGSISLGLNKKGELKRKGGYGILFDDEGSGAWIGLQALKAAILSREKRGPFTLLEKELIGKEEIRKVVKGLKENTAQKLASFFPIVVNLADRDRIAQQIISQAVKKLVKLASSLAFEIFEKNETKVVHIHGGLFKEVKFLKLFVEQAERNKLKVKHIELPVSYGAALMALRLKNADKNRRRKK